jgi:hypothetical protein
VNLFVVAACDPKEGRQIIRKIVIAALPTVALTSVSATAADAATWRRCQAPTYTMTGEAYYGRWSGLETYDAQCSSARYAYRFLYRLTQSQPPMPRRFFDGYVTWRRWLRQTAGTTEPGCGWRRYVVTYREYESGTRFRFRLYESGC